MRLLLPNVLLAELFLERNETRESVFEFFDFLNFFSVLLSFSPFKDEDESFKAAIHNNTRFIINTTIFSSKKHFKNYTTTLSLSLSLCSAISMCLFIIYSNRSNGNDDF